MELDETQPTPRLDAHAATVASGHDTMPVFARRGAELALDPRYEPQGELARGGMGRILRARDRRLERPLAIKQLLHADAELRARFDREVQISVQLQHPAIVNVIDARTSRDGEPFLAMKLVNGTTLDRAIAARTTLRERFSLLPNVIAVVDALAYAHGRGVIHRDLKPHNVLIGEFGETVVIDWGLAKHVGEREDAAAARSGASDEHAATVVGAVMGTPLYMPREQALGLAVDARADVYALGAILYHVIAGRPPYAGARAGEILDLVISSAPPPLDAAALGIPQDLATIVQKAMARDAADRYPSARELAEDLARFQSGRLVASHHYSLGQLVRRFIARHRALVAVIAAALCVIGVGGALAMRRIVLEEREAQAQRIAADRHRAAAEASRADAEDLLDYTLVNLRDELRPIGKASLLDGAARRAMAYFDRHPTTGTPRELERRALALDNLGMARMQQGASDEALRLFQASRMLTSIRLAFAPQDVDALRSLAISHAHAGTVLDGRGETAAALREYQDAVRLEVELLARSPDDVDAMHDLAISHGRIGVHFLMHDDLARARTHFVEEAALSEKLAARDEKRYDDQLIIARAHLGDIAMENQDPAAALVPFRRAAELAARATARDPGDMMIVTLVSGIESRLGDALMSSGDLAGAQAAYERGLSASQRRLARDPTNTRAIHMVAGDHSRVGDLRAKRGLHREALASYRAAIEALERALELDPTNVVRLRDLSSMHVDTGNALVALGDRAAARTQLARGLELIERVIAREPQNPRWQEDRRINLRKLEALDARAR